MTGFAIFSIITAFLSLFKKPENSRVDENGKLHGLNGTCLMEGGRKFKGEWFHGNPVQGVYTSANGIKKSGKWCLSEEIIPQKNGYKMVFNGLMLVANDGSLVPYEGVGKIQLFGDSLEIQYMDGKIIQETMTFDDATAVTGVFEELNDEETCGYYKGSNREGFTGSGILTFKCGTFI